MLAVRRRYNPFQDINSEVERMMRRHIDSGAYFEESGRELSAWSPRADIIETKEEIQIKLDLPGMEEKDIQVTVENNILTISGERQHNYQEKDENYHRVECRYGSFSRSFTLSRTVDSEKIKASYKNGVLQLTLPKREESKPKRIDVKIQ